uniref:Uncharacterized protein n=1 Tax=Arundo donax TaxID=35708 RepID=A0A0A8ZK39_ARUDO
MHDPSVVNMLSDMEQSEGYPFFQFQEPEFG